MMKFKVNPQINTKWGQHFTQCTITSTIWYELWIGVQRHPSVKKQEALQIFLRTLQEDMQILPYDDHAAYIHAAEQARLMSLGLTPSYRDAQIAAVAMANNLTVVTRNTSDFQYFQDLSLENWFAFEKE